MKNILIETYCEGSMNYIQFSFDYFTDEPQCICDESFYVSGSVERKYMLE